MSTKPYKCRKCGGSQFKVWGGVRRCAICWPAYMREWEKNHAEERRSAKSEKYHKRKAARLQSGLGKEAAYPRGDDKPHRDKRNRAIAKGNVTKEELLEVVQRDGGKCIYCGDLVITNCNLSRVRGFDHLFPLLGKGEHTAWNMAVCCINCNAWKGQRSFLEFIEDEEIPFTNFPQIPGVHFGLEEMEILEDEDFWE